jgi:hypothetical protein
MLKKSTKTRLKDAPKPISKWKTNGMRSMMAALLLLLYGCTLWAQGGQGVRCLHKQIRAIRWDLSL